MFTCSGTGEGVDEGLTLLGLRQARTKETGRVGDVRASCKGINVPFKGVSSRASSQAHAARSRGNPRESRISSI